MPVTDPFVGKKIGGAYTVLELVGVGGMGRIYRAEHSMLGRTVAIKVIHPHLLGNPDLIASFYSEARIASRLNHPNSVGILDFGRSDDGNLYLVMEFLQGKDLATLRAEEGPLALRRCVSIVGAILDALAQAHALGIVHRDLKPENVVVETKQGADVVKVVDFGLAALAGTAAQSGAGIYGTADYMAPEQARGETPEAFADLYGAGIVLFELLTDELPFPAAGTAEIAERHAYETVPDPRDVSPQREIPEALAQVCMRAMAKSPRERFATAAAMAVALRASLPELSRASVNETPCPNCAFLNANSMRFCGSCGAILKEEHARLLSKKPISANSIFPNTLPPLVGRAVELVALEQCRRKASQQLERVHLEGEVGVGKTRLLYQLWQNASADGDLVAFAGPHPTRALVAYDTVRALFCALVGIHPAELPELVKSTKRYDDPMLRAGIDELMFARGLVGVERASRVDAVAEVVAHAIRDAAETARSKRVGLIVDDLSFCDGSSRAVLHALRSRAQMLPVFIATASHRPLSRDERDGLQTLAVHGLRLEDACAVVTGAAPSTLDALPKDRPLLHVPLFLEQLRALGDGFTNDRVLPARLEDALSARLQNISPAAHLLLQKASIYGENVLIATLSELASDAELVALSELCASGILQSQDGFVAFAHPFVRDFVVASIPAGARRDLYTKALSTSAGLSAPLEVRAEFAALGSDLVGALVLLERAGDNAVARADYTSAIHYFRRGLDVARRERFETNEPFYDTATITFSRKLGVALDGFGDFGGAEGVLREALDLTARDGLARAPLLIGLGNAALRREKNRDAARIAMEAQEIATRFAERELIGESHYLLARIHIAEGDTQSAIAAFEKAISLLEIGHAPPLREAEARVAYAEALIDRGSWIPAGRELEVAYELAREHGSPALAAMAFGTMGTVKEVRGDTDAAAVCYREARRLAATAGDLRGRDRWKKALDARKRSGS